MFSRYFNLTVIKFCKKKKNLKKGPIFYKKKRTTKQVGRSNLETFKMEKNYPIFRPKIFRSTKIKPDK